MNEALQEAKKECAVRVVRSLYTGFDVEMLERILDVGRKYEPEALESREDVLYMNEALALEIARRKATR